MSPILLRPSRMFCCGDIVRWRGETTTNYYFYFGDDIWLEYGQIMSDPYLKFILQDRIDSGHAVLL